MGPPSSPVSQRPSLRLRLTLTTPMVTTERGLLMLSPRPLPRLILPSSMAPTTHTPTLVSTVDMPDSDTLMLTMVTTTARGPLMLSPPLLLSPLPMLMPTTATTAMVSGPTTATVWDTEDTLDTTVWATEPSGDRFSPPEVESRSSKRTSLLVI